ncbi:hypothetical protein APY04_1857 [Hyphomicrobium sulfonivorans]|uniref:Uncharacterized protein n=2 Tax=Hyphomicrobium sulfonivorans TaxID=121290 RepID=A0A125NUR8_HYPSL|nr:hypothetical protein APY04_1857 [Hyphomicrobium sulfonivorans]
MFGLFSVTRRKTSAESLLAAVTETSDARAAARETLQRALEALDGLDEVIRTASDDINPTQAGQSAPRGYIGGDEHVTH